MSNKTTETNKQTYALGLRYHGYQYSGWQRQNNTNSVQQELETALSKVGNQTITVNCAGRTDAGVHATEQVISFHSTAKRSLNEWSLGSNANLPHNIRVQWVKPMPEQFHARFNATARHYCYLISTHNVAPCILKHLVTWHRKTLNIEAMHDAAQLLVGKHDFSAFRSSQCQAKTAIREIKQITVTQYNKQLIILEISANAFLHHMVRNIVGSLFTIGEGSNDKHWLANVLASKNRTQAGITAPADGLYLTGVSYPEHYGLPNHIIKPLFL